MAEEFVMENDYTLSVVTTNEIKLPSFSSSYPSKGNSSLTRTFNFMAAQVTTLARDSIFESHGSESGGSAALATQMFIENFSDIDSKAEIALMREKLIELGGHPPALPNTLDKKPAAGARL